MFTDNNRNQTEIISDINTKNGDSIKIRSKTCMFNVDMDEKEEDLLMELS